MNNDSFIKNISLNKDNKSKYWYVSFIGFDGRQKRRSTKVPVNGGMFKGGMLSMNQAKNRALAEGYKIAELDGEKTKKDLEENNNVTVREFLDQYIKKKKPYISDNTYSNIMGAINRYCLFLGKKSDLPLRFVKRKDAVGFSELRRKEVRAESVRKDTSHLSGAFNYALDNEIITRNPFARLLIEPDRRDEKLVHEAFSMDEIQFMVDTFPPEWASAVRCSFETFGQRLGDILSLRWRQFDFVRKVVTITTGKTGKLLIQPMREGFYQWARNEFARRKESGMTLENDWLHPVLSGKRNASFEFGQLLRVYGIGITSSPQLGKRKIVNSKTFHSTRATCVTLLQSGGVASGISMKLVGHDSKDIHEQYNRPDVEQMRVAANALPILNSNI